MSDIVALFVEKGGCYFGVPNVDAWDISRNAMDYKGDLPVVCHPPCQLWGRFAAINYKRWGGEHNKPGNDGGCFAFALDAVLRCGGVLEHPADTNAWVEYGLQKPTGVGWQKCKNGGWVCEVWQSAYGHKARKRTWLFYFGSNPPEDPRLDRPDGTHQIGFHDQRGKAANKPTISGKAASATPVAFRDYLIDLARKSKLHPPAELCA